MSIKKDFIIGLQNYKLAYKANTVLMGRIGHARQLVEVLKSNDEIFFDSHFEFICLKNFKKCTPNFVPFLLDRDLGLPIKAPKQQYV